MLAFLFVAFKEKYKATIFKNCTGAVYDGRKNVFSPSALTLGKTGKFEVQPASWGQSCKTFHILGPIYKLVLRGVAC
jgi:hypothetical protein